MALPSFWKSAAVCLVLSGVFAAAQRTLHPVNPTLPSTGSTMLQPVQATQVPAVVTLGHAQTLRSVELGKTMPLVLTLGLRNEAALDTLIARLYDPAGKSFHQYLTPDQFDAEFAATEDDYAKVIGWAESKGLKVTGKVANRHLLKVEGTVSEINFAFNVSLTAYKDLDHDRDFFAPDREPQVDLTVPLAGISGLDNAVPKHNHLKKDPALANALPASIALDTHHASGLHPNIAGSGPGNTYLPSDMRAAYYGGNLTGSGQTVGIFSYDGYQVPDIQNYYAASGFNSTIPVVNEYADNYNGACFGFNANGSENAAICDDGEQILDIMQVQGMAPGLTKIIFYESDTAATELNLMVTDNSAKIITSSWGGGDFGTSSDTYFKQMATQGQTYLNATGDDGAFNSSTYDPPSLDPYILQVGGTDLTTVGAGGAWSSETAWTDSGGGFRSTAGYAIPSWQTGTCTTAVSATTKCSTAYRNAPDMAAEADFDNTTEIAGVFSSGYGGTSFATPRIAGYLALANQQASENGLAPVGFVNPTLYTLGLGSSASTTYHDITSGSDPSTAGTATSYTAVAGYDLPTGWGSPNLGGLINGLAGAPVADYAIAASTAAMTITRGAANGSNTITVTPFNSFKGTVSLAASGLPTGVTASFTTATESQPSTMTIVADAATAIQGTYTITVTGTDGNLSHTAAFVLNVLKRTNGDYTIAAANVAALIGGNASSTVTITPGAISGYVTWAVSNVPSGVTATATVTDPNVGKATDPAAGGGVIALSVAANVPVGVYTMTVTGTSLGNLVHATTFTLTVSAPPSVVSNGGFETVSGTVATGWTTTSGVLCTAAACGDPAHSGTYYMYLDGYGTTHTDTVSQSGIVVTAGTTKATLSFWVGIVTAETTTTLKNDTFTVTMTPTGGTATTVATLSNLNASSSYVLYSYDVSAFIGKTVTLLFTGKENSSKATSFLLDDVSLTVQ